MADKILKQVLLSEVIVRGMILTGIGPVEDPDLYPDHFIKLSVNPEDFVVNEEYHTVMRILTKIARRKATEAIEQGKLNVIREKSNT